MPDKNWQFELEEYIKQGETLYMDIPFLYNAEDDKLQKQLIQHRRNLFIACWKMCKRRRRVW